MTGTVTVEDMRDKLRTLDSTRETLGQTEPLSQVSFPTRGSAKSVARFKLNTAWNAGLDNLAGLDPVDATVKLGSVEYRLTKDALLEATSGIGLTKNYVAKTPANLVEPHLNYWFSNRDGEGKLLALDDLVVGFTKASIIPFSNLRLLDEAVAGIQDAYGDGEVLVDYKFQHDLRSTALRLIVPEERRAVREGDEWSVGLQVQNSLVGERPLSLQGYLFRWSCTNGATSTHATSGNWNRRVGGQGDEVYEWARHAVDEILGGLEHELDAVEELASAPLELDSSGAPDVAGSLDDVFHTYGVPVEARESIIQNMVNSDDLTMYGIQAAVTQAANEPDMSEGARARLLEIGGDLPRANTDRCLTCRRLSSQ